MKSYFKLFALLSMIACFTACALREHPTGDPKKDAAIYHKMLYDRDVQGANQFADEVLEVYMQKYSVSSHEAYRKIDEFWEENAKLKK